MIKLLLRFKQSSLYLIIFIEFLVLTLAISLPLARIDEFWFFSSEFSIISLIFTLFDAQEYFLSLIIFTFGCFLPALKIIQKALINEFVQKLPLHKFAMLDIFLLSLLIFGGKLSYFYEVKIESGFYFLMVSIFLSYLPLTLFDPTKNN